MDLENDMIVDVLVRVRAMEGLPPNCYAERTLTDEAIEKVEQAVRADKALEIVEVSEIDVLYGDEIDDDDDEADNEPPNTPILVNWGLPEKVRINPDSSWCYPGPAGHPAAVYTEGTGFASLAAFVTRMKSN